MTQANITKTKTEAGRYSVTVAITTLGRTFTHTYDFVRLLLAAPVPRIALENPVSVISTRVRKPDQIIQPWQFGHGETKKTCLWLKGLPKLVPTNIVSGRETRIHNMAPGPDRWKKTVGVNYAKSCTYIAKFA